MIPNLKGVFCTLTFKLNISGYFLFIFFSIESWLIHIVVRDLRSSNVWLHGENIKSI